MTTFPNHPMILIATSCFVLGSSTFAQTAFRVSGTVRDKVTGEPVPNVNVIVRGYKGGTTTDASGVFRINLRVGTSYMLVFSHVSYYKMTGAVSTEAGQSVEIDINLAPQTIRLGEVVVTANRPFSLTPAEVQRASFSIDGNEFERLGEPDPERAMEYLLPEIVHPLRDRLARPKEDFTLYVDGEWMESAYLANVNPFTIKRVLVWELLGLSHDNVPMGLPLRRGRKVILIETNVLRTDR